MTQSSERRASVISTVAYLEKRSQIFERHLRARNIMRMQELLDEESFDRWNQCRQRAAGTGQLLPNTVGETESATACNI